MTKITEVTQIVTELYSLRSMTMSEHESRYFVMDLSAMIEQSASRMLAWATRWKRGIYNSMRQEKMIASKRTVPTWKIWEPDKPNEPMKKVDNRQVTESRQQLYKNTKIMTTLRVNKRC